MKMLGLSEEVTLNQKMVLSEFEKSPILMGIIMIIFGPIMEEIIFRINIKQIFRNIFIYYLLSGFLFGAVHNIRGFSFPISLIQVISYFLSGLVLAIIYKKSKNIWCSIIVHVTINTLIVISLLSSLYEGGAI